jgi:hypothetical protein
LVDGANAVCFDGGGFVEETSPNTQKRNRPTLMQITHANFASMLSGFELVMPVCGMDWSLDSGMRVAGASTALLASFWTARAAP